jgi:hypothetical protein
VGERVSREGGTGEGVAASFETKIVLEGGFE